ncbi:hypothetical protein SAMN04487792_1520 [Lactobacillus bombicola]|uniref:Uncharacterized protein n=1 Tax=Lactobacillus bombicola TaxID=1505723 RepID=A0A1I1TX16_9LACO|nr:hypothetical protein [Lactobacillus bombicola]SFD60120.1 hypothetical protein SAMN04487792_1520 [Lactobacillus bombicola]
MIKLNNALTAATTALIAVSVVGRSNGESGSKNAKTTQQAKKNNYWDFNCKII